MGLFLNVLTPHLLQETSQHGRNANMMDASIQGPSIQSKSLHQEICELLERGRIGGHSTIELRKAQNPARSQDAHQLSHKGNPGIRMEKTKEKTSIDKIKGCIRKIKRLEQIHHPKFCVIQSLNLRQRLCILNHALTDVNTHNPHFWVSIRQLLHPASRPAGSIQRTAHLRKPSLRKESAHTFGHKPILIYQARHLCTTFRIDDITVRCLLHADDPFCPSDNINTICILYHIKRHQWKKQEKVC